MAFRRREGRARMDDPCTVIIAERSSDAVLVDLSPRGARVVTSEPLGAPGGFVTLGYKGQLIRAEVRFHEVTPAGIASGLRLIPAGREERGVLRRSLRERLLQARDGNRSHVRLSTRWNAVMLSHDHLPAVVSDIAIGGVGLHTDAPVACGQRMILAFDAIGGDEPFVVTGTVQHAIGGYVGLHVVVDDHERFYDQMQACWELGDGV